MIYVADGPSDVPVFSILNQYGGKTYAVYKNEGSIEQFRQAKALAEQDRVQGYGPAEYSDGTHTYMWLTTAVQDIALAIVSDPALRPGQPRPDRSPQWRNRLGHSARRRSGEHRRYPERGMDRQPQ
jgi:hypothetical protein